MATTFRTTAAPGATYSDDFRYHSIDLEPTGDERIEDVIERVIRVHSLLADHDYYLALPDPAMQRAQDLLRGADAGRTGPQLSPSSPPSVAPSRRSHAGSVYNRFLLSDRSGDSWNRETETSPSLSRYRAGLADQLSQLSRLYRLGIGLSYFLHPYTTRLSSQC